MSRVFNRLILKIIPIKTKFRRANQKKCVEVESSPIVTLASSASSSRFLFWTCLLSIVVTTTETSFETGTSRKECPLM
jgi:hypothetical protein